MFSVLSLRSSRSTFLGGGGFGRSGIDVGKATGSSITVNLLVERKRGSLPRSKNTHNQVVPCLSSSAQWIPHLRPLLHHRHQSSVVLRFCNKLRSRTDMTAKMTSTDFLAPLRRSASSRSRCATSRARCCARFSAAVMRGIMSGKGLSMMETDLIFGGLGGVGFSQVESPTKRQKENEQRYVLYWSFILIELCHGCSFGCLQQNNTNTYPSLRSSRHLGGTKSLVEPMDKRSITYCIAYHPQPSRIAYACHVAHPPDLIQPPCSLASCGPENNGWNAETYRA